MNLTRSDYVEYIAKGIREVLKTTGKKKLPEGLIIITKSWSKLSEYDHIMKIPIFICDIPSSFDFFFANPADNEDWFQKEFLEYMNIFEITEAKNDNY